MSIEQSLSQAPLGLQDIELDDTPAVEIEIVNPEGVKIDMDGIEIDLMPETEEEDFSDNLAEYMDDSELQKIASDLIEMVDTDVNSRKDWVEIYVNNQMGQPAYDVSISSNGSGSAEITPTPTPTPTSTPTPSVNGFYYGKFNSTSITNLLSPLTPKFLKGSGA